MADVDIYLDHAASTPMTPAALARYSEVAAQYFGNPSGLHRQSRQAKAILEDARERCAQQLGRDPSEVVFTSGGTEGDNFAVLCPVLPPHARILSTRVEHHGVLEPLRSRTNVSWIEVDRNGVIDVERLEHDLAALGDQVGLMVVMAVNNETGVVSDLSSIADLRRRYAPQALLFSDAVQGAPWLDLEKSLSEVDLATLSAHKFGGPRGVGIVLRRRGVETLPLLRGGGQEFELRSGSQNVAGIASAVLALEERCALRDQNNLRVEALQSRLESGLVDIDSSIEIVGRLAPRVPGITNSVVKGIANEEAIFLADEQGLALSGGASCASGALEPSHVLKAMGYSDAAGRSCLRWSLGVTTTVAEIDRALEIIEGVIRSLRGGRS
ncbi:MAG: cysteine desulfurase family protein [Acidimicrobiales bacterium]